MDSFDSKQIRISHNLRYPLVQLEDVLHPLFEKDYNNESLRVTIESANHIWCAYEDGQCVGCVLITDIGSEGGLYVILFGVKKSEQCRGIGRRLLEKIIRWSRKHRYAFIYLHTEHENENAIRLYERFGFEKVYSQSNLTEELPQFGSDVLAMMLVI